MSGAAAAEARAGRPDTRGSHAPLENKDPCTSKALCKEAQGQRLAEGVDPKAEAPGRGALWGGQRAGSGHCLYLQNDCLPEKGRWVLWELFPVATDLGGRHGRQEPGRVSSAFTGKQRWPARPWSLAHKGTQAVSEGASLGSRCLPVLLATPLCWTCREGLERPHEPCKPVPEKTLQRGMLAPMRHNQGGSPPCPGCKGVTAS